MARKKIIGIRSAGSKGSVRLNDTAVKAWKETVKDSEERNKDERKVVFR